MKSILFSAIAALLVFNSCQKEGNAEEETKPGCRLIKVTQGLDPRMDSIYMFRYHPDGRLAAMNMRFAVDLYYDWMDFVYKPGTSRVEKISYKENPYFPFLLKYEYDDQGRILKYNYELGQEYTYQYDNKGQLSRVDASAGGYAKDYYYQTTFDNNGNLIECYRKNIADDIIIEGYTVEYSNIENSIAMLGALNHSENMGLAHLLPGSDFYPVPCKHLPIAITFRNAKKEPYRSARHTFETDASNNITKAVVKYDASYPIVKTWKFEYDCDPQ